MLRSALLCPVAIALAALLPGCRESAPASQLQRTIQARQTRQAGSWEGTGNRTIGFLSESGVFRISWKARDRPEAGAGTFLLTVRSAISGRPIRVVADQHGDGSGTVDFVDDPRLYEFMVDSAGVDWSFNAEELVDVERTNK